MKLALLPLCLLLACSAVPQRSPSAVAAVEMEGLWVLQIRRQNWQPRDLEFVLSVEPSGDSARGSATLDPVFTGRTTSTLSDFQAQGDRVQFTLTSVTNDAVAYHFRGVRDGRTLDGKVRWSHEGREHVEPFTAYQREVRTFDTTIPGFPVADDPTEVGVHPVLLDRLVMGAETARSDSLLVLSDGKLVAARLFGGKDSPRSVGALSYDIAGTAPGVTMSGAHFAGWVPSDNLIALRRGVETPSKIATYGLTKLELLRTWSEPDVDAPTSPSISPAAPWTHYELPLGDGVEPAQAHALVNSAGEALLVYPDAELVVVRTIDRVENSYDHRYDQRDSMGWVVKMADAIAIEKLSQQAR